MSAPAAALVLSIALLAACERPTPATVDAGAVAESAAELRAQVAATETAFAKTMADRDLAAFAGFIAEDCVFFSGPQPLHGRDGVVEFWKRFYDGPQAPFSWRPDKVEVLAAGDLALSTGPVFDPAGKPTGSFTSVWRREASGRWRIVFDLGNEACDCARAAATTEAQPSL